MNWLVLPLRDLLVWTFETFLESAQNLPNILFVILCFSGLFIWLKTQGKYNKEAESNPNQIK